MTKDEYIKLNCDKELAKRDFFIYCQIKAPDFYKKERAYQKTLCDTLIRFLSSNKKLLVINMPPRHGKSRTAGLAVEWLLGIDKTKKIMTGSYNERLSITFSKNVRNSIQEQKADEKKLVYSDIFPDTRIKQGDGAMNLWALEGGYNNYLATSPTGTATGFGADIIIIDDLIKNSMEANNVDVLDKHWEWFTNTMLSRLEEGGKIIIIMTRWHSDDLAGRALKHFDDNDIEHINFKALQDDGTMLCDDILSQASYNDKAKLMDVDIVSANYQQQPIDIKGKLYTRFKTYEKVPQNEKGALFETIKAYVDTADQGKDYLCQIIYGVYKKEAYILDVYYTKDAMETTEKEAAKRLYEHGVNVVDVESNNGGRGWARQIESILRDYYKTNKCFINWFHQSKNKQARIISNATWVMNHIYYPINWRDKWPEYYNSMSKYQREGKNAHDDAQDATTGVAEMISASGDWLI